MRNEQQSDEDREHERYCRDQSEHAYYTLYGEFQDKYNPYLDVIEGQCVNQLNWLANNPEIAEELYKRLEQLDEVYKVKVEINNNGRAGLWRVEVVHNRGAFAVNMWLIGRNVEVRPC